MGADSFHVCYGLRWEIDSDNADEITRLELKQDPRQVAAARHGLDCWWGQTIDEMRYFLLIGKIVGHFGYEFDDCGNLEDAKAAHMMEETRERLSEAGFEARPGWHFQFSPDR